MSDILSLGQRLRSTSVSCEALARAALDAIRSLEPTLNAFISVTEDYAISTARERDSEMRAGRDRGPLHGIPIVYKDCIDTGAIRTTVGSLIFRHRIPECDAAVVQRLNAAGAVLLGKTNMNELAAGGPGGYNKFYGSTRNPWNLEHESGGSSSGTGAAIAAGICPVGLGTDSGGSIRGPASHMGVVGLRPTIGRFDMSGIFPRAQSLDTCGPLAESVLDAAIVFNALLDERKWPSIHMGTGTLDGVRLGVVEKHTFDNVQDEVAVAVRAALHIFERLGVQLVSVSVPELAQQTTLAEAGRVLVYEFARDFGEIYRNMGDQEAFGPIVHADMRKANDVSRSDYEAAIRFKRHLSTKIAEVLRNVDALVTPTMARTAPLATHPDLSGAHRRFTLPVSFAGLPAISIPCGIDARGLPIGLQLIGANLAEQRLLAIARAYEVATQDVRTWPACHFDLASAV